MEQSKWQSMESAPLDGTVVLLYGVPHGEIHGELDEPTIVVARFAHRTWSLTSTDYYAVWVNDPLAWMPLPTPPVLTT